MRELFEQLGALLELGGGHARVTARFSEGRLGLSVRIAHFRIGAANVGPLETRFPLLRPQVSAEAQAVLIQLAELLHRVEGETEIVAEYQDRKLRTVDHIIEMELALPTTRAERERRP